jgi:glycosyltransferase involved in cell wall biosynthesis
VDDGSPDDTAAVARQLVAALPGRRVRLVRQQNAGLAAARNAGIAASTGRYVLPLDADDLLDPAFLERTVGALESNPGAAMAFTDVFTFGSVEELRPMGPFAPDVLRQRNVACATSLFRRSAWEQVGGYNPNMVLGYEDWDFWIGFAERGLQAVHIPEALFFYRLKPGSMVTQALRHHVQLSARAILNHPGFFDAALVARARQVLETTPLPPPRPVPAPAEVHP